MIGIKFIIAAIIVHNFPKLSESLLTNNYSTSYEVNSLSELVEAANKFTVGANKSTHTLTTFDRPPLGNGENNFLKLKNGSHLEDKVFVPITLARFDFSDFDRNYKTVSTKGTSYQHHHNDDNTTVLTEKTEKPPKTTGYFAEAGNNTILIKNGKKYKVIKVKKKVAIPSNRKENEGERRKFQQLPTSLSYFSTTRWSAQDDRNQSNDSDNFNFWSKLNTIQGEKKFSTSSLESGDKIKKLLNLFTIVKFDNKECFVNGMSGICLHQLECEQRRMKYASTCAEGLGVCCYHGITCGEESNQTLLFLSNDEFLDSLDTPQICTLTINKSDPQIVQFRVEFLDFQLKGPTNGTCLHDRLVITGQSSNSVIPEICGINTGQHLYLHVHDSDGPFNLNLITMEKYFPRSFRLKVTQLKNGDELSSPNNCLQYFIEPIGKLQTFNYPDISDESGIGYFNNLNYAICIKKLKGICSISYENEELHETIPAFQFRNMDTEGESLLPPFQAGAETFDCPDDYIIISGLRLCGEKLNDVSIDVDLTKNYPVTDTSNGPFIVFVRTDSAINGRGLNIKYRQNPCST